MPKSRANLLEARVVRCFQTFGVRTPAVRGIPECGAVARERATDPQLATALHPRLREAEQLLKVRAGLVPALPAAGASHIPGQEDLSTLAASAPVSFLAGQIWKIVRPS